MLTGVCTVSSARTNDGWLSEDSWRTGMSTEGALALLNGLEKLKAGLGRCVPPTENSELMEGDLASADMDGDIGEVWLVLADESFRSLESFETPFCPPRSSSSLSVDMDLGLGFLAAKGDFGGAKVLGS